MPITSTPTFTGTEYINRPFSYTFSSDFSASPYQIRFTGSSPALLASTSGDTFFSTTGFSGSPGSAGTLAVSAVMTDPPFTVVDSSNYPVTVLSRIDVSDSAISGIIQLYKFEPFGGNTYTANLGGDTLSFSRSSAVVLSSLSSNANVITFASTTGYQAASSSNLLVIDAISNSAIQDTVTRTVNVGAGRFTAPVSNSTITLYKNEPFTPVRFTAPLVISTPVSSVALPSGLSFVQVDGSNYDLSGLPILQQPFSNYQIIGRGIGTNISKIVTTTVSIGVNGERVLLDLSGSQDFSNLTTSSVITPATVTARFPPYPYGGTLRYTWSPPLLPGFSFSTIAGNSNQSSNNFFPEPYDTSYSIILSGQPNSNTISTLVSLNSNTYTINLVGTRIAPLPVISNTKTFTFQFSPAILFDQVSTPTLFANIAIPSNSVYFGAKTVLSPTDVSITGISLVGGSLPAGLTLDFSSNAGRAFINGTPANTASPSFTLRASNALALTQDYTTSLSIINDSVTFDSVLTPATDTCYNFIQFRPVTTAKTGWYPGSIQFKASALSGCNVTMTASALSGTGITFTSNASNTYILGGAPTIGLPLTTLTVTATAQGSGATVSRNVKFSISDEIITVNDVSLTFIQNRAITPVQLSGSTLSERPITVYTTTTAPNGVNLSTSGYLSGTPTGDTNGTMTLIASTGYSSVSKGFPYTITPDSILLTTASNTYPLVVGGPVPSIEVVGVSYSGIDVSNFQFSNLSPTYGLTIGSNTGFFGGTLTDCEPPNDVLPASDSFQVKASAGLLDASLDFTLVTTDPLVYRTFLCDTRGDGITPNIGARIYSADNISNWNLYQDITSTISQLSSFDRRYTGFQNQTLIFSGLGGSLSSSYVGTTIGQVLRFSNLYSLPSVINVNSSNFYVISSVANKTTTNTWFAAGARRGGSLTPSNLAIRLQTSTDDGLTWSSESLVADQSGSVLIPRGNAALDPITNNSAFTSAGSTMKYKNGVLLLGGVGTYVDASFNVDPKSCLVRSTDDGASWTRVTSSWTPSLAGTTSAMYDMNVDDSNVWVALGSDSNVNPPIQYSIDQGATWSYGSGNTGTLGILNTPLIPKFGSIVYGSNTWLVSYSNILRFSKDGSNWSVCDLPLDIIAPTPTTSMYFDGSNFNVFARYGFADNDRLYSCPASSDLSLNNWSFVVTSFPNSSAPFTVVTSPSLTQSTSTFLARLDVNAYPPGPTFIGPTSINYLFNQYVPIPTITVSASGVGPVYYFVDNGELPVGLRFDPLTAQITGTPARTGTTVTRVFAKDNAGVSSIAITITVIIPRIIRQQTSASAYTSMVRQYTLVNAAQNARGNRVLTEDGKQGEFMAPMGLDNLIPNNCFICDPNISSNA